MTDEASFTPKEVVAPPPWVKKFPFREHPQSEEHALIIVEHINPHLQYRFRCYVTARSPQIQSSCTRSQRTSACNDFEVILSAA